MTMFSETRQQQFYGGGEGGFMRGNYGIPGSDLVVVPMAEEDDEFTTNSLNELQESTSKKLEEEDDQGSWLQLSIGGGGGGDLENTRKNNGSGLLELDLMPSSQPDFRPPRPVTGPPSFYPHPHLHLHNTNTNNQEINWAFRPIPISISPSPPSMASGSSYFPRPFQIYDVAQGADFRVIQPPRRPHSGGKRVILASNIQELLENQGWKDDNSAGYKVPR